MVEKCRISGLDIIPINNENSRNLHAITESQSVCSNNVCRLREISQKDYSDFRQLMDIALKDFAFEEKEKYIDVFCKDDSFLMIDSDFSDEFEPFRSSESSAALPYEIQFDGDDDFEQVLPNVVSRKVPMHNDYVLCSESFPKLDSRSKLNFISIYKKQKTRIWTKLRRFFKRFNCKKKPSDPSKDIQRTSESLRHNIADGNVWQPMTAHESSLSLHTEG